MLTHSPTSPLISAVADWFQYTSYIRYKYFSSRLRVSEPSNNTDKIGKPVNEIWTSHGLQTGQTDRQTDGWSDGSVMHNAATSDIPTFVIGASNVMDGIRATDSFRIWKRPVPKTRHHHAYIFISQSSNTCLQILQINSQLEQNNRSAQSKYVYHNNSKFAV